MVIKKFDFADTDLIDKNIRVEKKAPDRFEESTLSLIEIDVQQGIFAIAGRLKGDNVPNTAIQSYLFDKEMWTPGMAGDWVYQSEKTGEVITKGKNGEDIILKISEMLGILMDSLRNTGHGDQEGSISSFADLKSIRGVEIFATGTHNEEDYTIEDLNDIARNFQPLKSRLQPYVKLGHNEEQQLLATDGLPAAGWIENLYVKGNKLIADIKDIPIVVYKLIKNKAYKRISSEVYWNLKDDSGKIYRRALKAISLLGGDTPAVGSLADVQALYTKRLSHNFNKEIEGDLHIADFSINKITEEARVDEKQFKEQSDRVVDLTKTNSDLLKSVADKDALLKKFQDEANALKKATRAKEIKSNLEGLVNDGKLLPVQVELAEKLYTAQDSLKLFSKEDSDDVVTKFFDLAPKVVVDKEVTAEGVPKATDSEKEANTIKAMNSAKNYDEAKEALYTSSEGDKS